MSNEYLLWLCAGIIVLCIGIWIGEMFVIVMASVSIASLVLPELIDWIKNRP